MPQLRGVGGNGKLPDGYCCISFEVENGRITDGGEHFDNLYARDAFWAQPHPVRA